MEPSECYNALSYLIEKYVDDLEIKIELPEKLAYDKLNREIPPAKHYLSELHKHQGSMQISEEDGHLIKHIVFHYV
jgi:hypothetical protein